MSEGMREEKSEDMPETPHSSNRQKTVAIISKPGRPELAEVLPALEKWLRERNYAVVTDQESTAYFSSSNVIARSELAMRSPHLTLVLGADGTLLSAARPAGTAGRLILGGSRATLRFRTELAL